MSASQSLFSTRVPWPVISVGRDSMLLRLREASITKAGIAVQSMAPEQAEFPAHDGKPRIWVMCGSVEESSLVYLACTIRRYSATSRLFLVEWIAPAGAEKCLFHRVMDREGDEGALALAIRNCCRVTSELGD